MFFHNCPVKTYIALEDSSLQCISLGMTVLYGFDGCLGACAGGIAASASTQTPAIFLSAWHSERSEEYRNFCRTLMFFLIYF